VPRDQRAPSGASTPGGSEMKAWDILDLVLGHRIGAMYTLASLVEGSIGRADPMCELGGAQTRDNGSPDRALAPGAVPGCVRRPENGSGVPSLGGKASKASGARWELHAVERPT